MKKRTRWKRERHRSLNRRAVARCGRAFHALKAFGELSFCEQFKAVMGSTCAMGKEGE